MSDKQTKAFRALRDYGSTVNILIEDFIEYVENNGCDKYIFIYFEAKEYYNDRVRSVIYILYAIYSEESS